MDFGAFWTPEFLSRDSQVVLIYWFVLVYFLMGYRTKASETACGLYSLHCFLYICPDTEFKNFFHIC
jgi:hypothetical protein